MAKHINEASCLTANCIVGEDLLDDDLHNDLKSCAKQLIVAGKGTATWICNSSNHHSLSIWRYTFGTFDGFLTVFVDGSPMEWERI